MASESGNAKAKSLNKELTWVWPLVTIINEFMSVKNLNHLNKMVASTRKGEKNWVTTHVQFTFLAYPGFEGNYLEMNTQSNTIWIQVNNVNCDKSIIFGYFPANK